MNKKEWLEKGAIIEYLTVVKDVCVSNEEFEASDNLGKIILEIKNGEIPAADVAPVVHGCWEDIYQRDIYIPDEKTTMTLTEEKCSNCCIVTKFIGDKLFLHDFVCPNCGAKMDMDGENNG